MCSQTGSRRHQQSFTGSWASFECTRFPSSIKSYLSLSLEHDCNHQTVNDRHMSLSLGDPLIDLQSSMTVSSICSNKHHHGAVTSSAPCAPGSVGAATPESPCTCFGFTESGGVWAGKCCFGLTEGTGRLDGVGRENFCTRDHWWSLVLNFGREICTILILRLVQNLSGKRQPVKPVAILAPSPSISTPPV